VDRHSLLGAGSGYAAVMMSWTASLSAETRALVGTLEERDCRFVWRDRTADAEQSEPFAEGQCWFELWQDGRMLVFFGPLNCPAHPAELQVMAPLLRQADYLSLQMRPRVATA
jgi:hypothetical protein